MVTRDRVALAERAVHCLIAQRWPARELVVVDDGEADYGPMLARYHDRLPIRYLRIEPEPGRKLGELRNVALEACAGDYVAQWDDDEWYHPERLATQVEALERDRLDAVVLDWTLMHVDADGLREHLYRADVGAGTPGTIVHRRTSVRYPNLARAEDSEFLRRLARRGRVGSIDRSGSHLFVRCFHGGNTWQRGHFLRRLRRTPSGLAAYLVDRARGRPLTAHPAFRLDPRERAAATAFLAESRALGLVPG
jgi:glycosyltransferase involved in cell wall biosynthesis